MKYVLYAAGALFIFIVLLLTLNKTSIIKTWDFFPPSQTKAIFIAADSLTVIRSSKKAFDLRLTDPIQTVTIATQALKMAKKINYRPGVAEAYRIIGIGLSYQNKVHPAIKSYIRALHDYQSLNDLKNQARVQNNLGNLYRKICDSENALKYFRKCLTIARHVGDKELIAGLYFNLASVFEQKKDFKNALAYLDMSNAVLGETDEIHRVMYLQNKGLVFFNSQNFSAAERLFADAIVEAKKLNLYNCLTDCNLALASIYMQRRSYIGAKKALAEGLKYARMLKNKDIEQEFMYGQYELQRATKNFPEALRLLSIIYKRDSLELARGKSQSIEIGTQHYLQLQKLQEKDLIITKQKYNESILKWTTLVASLVILVGGMFVIILILVWQKRKKKNDTELQSKIAASEQKALHAMMNPHFVFNVMASIQYFVNQADNQMANYTLSKFASLARTHLEICMNNTISVGKELHYLKLYLSLEKVRFSDKMNYQISVDEKIDAEETHIPSMLIQPFVENAIIHGVTPKEKGGIVKLNFRLYNDELLISIVDDGIGIENSKMSKKGHVSRGIELIRERVDLINRLSKRHILINQQQLDLGGTEVLIRIPT